MEFSSKNTGAGCHVLLQWILPSWRLNQRLLRLLNWRQILYLWCHLCVNIFVFLWLTSLFMSGSRFITSQDPVWFLFITIFHCVYGRGVDLHFMSLSQDLGRTRLHFGELCCCSLDKRKWNTEYCILALRGVLTNTTHSISIHFFFFFLTNASNLIMSSSL